MSAPSAEAARVLEEGALCWVAVATPRGPHCTPAAFAFSDDRLWITTARSSAKARAWRGDPAAAAMVRAGDQSVSFAGRVLRHDALDPLTWPAALLDARAAAAATLRFTRKNARFFAGYAVDARDVPLAWTPPGRVFVSIDVERWAYVGPEGVRGRRGRWGGGGETSATFRAARAGADPFAALPADVADAVGRAGRGALAVEAPGGLVVLDASWVVDGAGLYAALPADAWGLAAAAPGARAAMVADRASAWRARDMVGVMAQGDAVAFDLRALGSGRRSAASIARSAGADADDVVLVRLSPRRLVWWRGWSSGTVVP